MRLVIGTPAYGGLFHSNYVHSMIETVTGLNREDVSFTFRAVGKEALINRARNSIADFAIRSDADKLLFIDADLGWTWEDVRALLHSDKLVVGGAYPKKTFPLTLNYNVKDEHAAIYHSDSTSGSTAGGQKDLETHGRLKAYADPKTGEVAIKHLPAGFMMIDIKVFYMLQGKVEAYRQFHPDKPARTLRNFFPIRVHDGILESEDWGFCSICRENDIEVYLNTNILLSHMGAHLFRMI